MWDSWPAGLTYSYSYTVFGTAKPCNPQGSQRLMGYLKQNLHSRQNAIMEFENINVVTTLAAIKKFVRLLNRIAKHNFIRRVILCTFLTCMDQRSYPSRTINCRIASVGRSAGEMCDPKCFKQPSMHLTGNLLTTTLKHQMKHKGSREG
jgi:hypothetical protein